MAEVFSKLIKMDVRDKEMSGVHIPIVLGGPFGGDRNSLQNGGLRILLLMMGLVQGTGVPCRIPLATRCCSSCPGSVVCSVVLCVRWWGQHIKSSLRCWGAVSMVEGHFSEPGTHIHRQANGSLETGSSSVPPSKAVPYSGHSTSFLILGLCRASSPSFSRGSCGIRIDRHASCLSTKLL